MTKISNANYQVNVQVFNCLLNILNTHLGFKQLLVLLGVFLSYNFSKTKLL